VFFNASEELHFSVANDPDRLKSHVLGFAVNVRPHATFFALCIRSHVQWNGYASEKATQDTRSDDAVDQRPKPRYLRVRREREGSDV
jgi:hypothetical protein